MKSLLNLIILCSFFININQLDAQYIKGKLIDQVDGSSMSNTELTINGIPFVTDPSGKFKVLNDFESEMLEISIIKDNFNDYKLSVENAQDKNIELGIIFLEAMSEEGDNAGDLFEGDDLEIFDIDQDVSSLLTAAWDPFSNLADFNFSITRFNPRGLSQDHSLIYLNNLPFNNLENGRYFWSLWGGLNDVTRNRYTQQGFNSSDYTVGGFAGSTDIDLRATKQRKGTRVSLTHSNRSYQYRAMVTHNSGVTENGFAYSLSASRRWGNSGYVEGTYYDAYSYFVSLDKEFSDKHSLNFTAMAAPSVRGRASVSTQFMYDLVDNNFYNPNWGYQNGKVRNSREYRSNQPVFTLRHDYNINENTQLRTSVGLQIGRYGTTRLGWLDAADPRPDYYGNLPYDNRNNLSENDLAALALKYQDEATSQIDFDNLYEINRNRDYEIVNINNPSQSTFENVSAYVIEEQRFDNNKMVIHSNIIHSFNDRVDMQGGLILQYDRNHNFKKLDDLLGGTYYLDIDGFALRDSNDLAFIQNDVAKPNRLLTEGDIFGYDYTIHNQNANLWSNVNVTLPKVDLTFSGAINHTSFWREGATANGKFPDDSKGVSEKASFVHGTLKVGATYKINGRNYLYGNIGYITKAPFSRNSFQSPQTRNFLTPNLTTEKVAGGEIGYVLRHPRLNARLTGYYIDSRDGAITNSFYLVDVGRTVGFFVNNNISGIDRINYGMELGLDFKLTSTISLGFASSVGEFYYNSRPDLLLTIDNSALDLSSSFNDVSYLDGFNKSSQPQVANTLKVEYRSPNYWSASLSATYMKDIYIDPNPVRRTSTLSQAIFENANTTYEGLTPEEVTQQLVAQEKFDPVFTLDLFVRKSWKIKEHRLAGYVSINNLLDNKNNITGGFEQLRFDYNGLDADRFASRYYYAYGRNYNLGLTFSL